MSRRHPTPKCALAQAVGIVRANERPYASPLLEREHTSGSGASGSIAPELIADTNADLVDALIVAVAQDLAVAQVLEQNLRF